MSISEALRKQAMQGLQAATTLNIAFIGVANGLFATLAAREPLSAESLADAAGLDPRYVARWCDAAFSFGYLDDRGQGFVLTDLGQAYRPEVPDSLMHFAVRSVLSAHMAERGADLMKTGRPLGDNHLEGCPALAPLFGAMLETSFAPFFEKQILPQIPAYRKAGESGGLAVDLGCGNGWYLRALLRHLPRLRGIGLDGMSESIAQARQRTREDGLTQRLRFEHGDIHTFAFPEPADVIAMNRALHHVWTEKESVFRLFSANLKPGGSVVIWEPNWPENREALRDPARRGMAFQNFTEHMQGNHLLRPAEIEDAFHAVGLTSEVHLFASGNEAVVVGTKRPES